MGSRHVRLLGDVTLTNDDVLIPLRPTQRRLLSLLAIGPGKAIDRDRLIHEMWGDEPPPTARNALQVHISALRRAAPGSIDSSNAGYALSTDSVSLDIHEFDVASMNALGRVDPQSWAPVLAECERAFSLWRGEPFVEIPDAERAMPERARLAELHLGVLERRVEALLAQGRDGEAISELERLVAAYPLRERFWEYLMLSRYRLGRQADALRAFKQVSAILGEELGIEPGQRLRALEEEILFQIPDVQLGAVAKPHTLPSITTSFVGRDDLITQVSDELRNHPMVTITGGPGVGKSRLALEVGWRMLDEFSAGVFFVGLEGATRVSDVAADIAANVHGLEEVDDLTMIGRILSDRPMLLILDNCEHVVPMINLLCAGAVVPSPSLRILATSRRRVGVVGEHAMQLRPLDLPEETLASTDELLKNPTVRLLIDRVRASTSEFRLADIEPDDLVGIAHQTDGVPLAIEMASRWIASLGLREFRNLREHVPDGALEGAIELSYRLMSQGDRDFLDASSVICGRATLNTLSAVCSPEGPLIESAGTVTRLVESSLLVNEVAPTGEMVFFSLQSVRQYAARNLVKQGRTDDLRARHAEWFTELAGALSTSTATSIIDGAMPDFRQALRWLLDAGENQLAASIANGLAPYWVARFRTWEADMWFSEILAWDDRPPSLGTLWNAGWISYNNNDYAGAMTRYGELASRAREEGDLLYEGRALYGAGRIEVLVDRRDGEARLGEALTLLRASGSVPDIAECVMALGIGYAFTGRPTLAHPHLIEAMDLLEDDHNPRQLSICLRCRSLASYHEGDEDAARGFVTSAVAVAEAANDRRSLSGALIQAALVECRWGDIRTAARHMADALAPVPVGSTIDTIHVLLGTLPVLVTAGATSMALEVAAQIDRVFDIHGWQPVHTVHAVVAEYRSRLPEIGAPAMDLLDARAIVQATLADIASAQTGRNHPTPSVRPASSSGTG
ncbi:MAG: BTAD domain-containing putative transcriptional regulator [Acidimicrobiia bacterium]